MGTIPQAVERLQKLQYKAVKKITIGYYSFQQDLMEKVSNVEPIQAKIRDMKVWATE